MIYTKVDYNSKAPLDSLLLTIPYYLCHTNHLV
jgi:hypothetical protein